MKISKKKLQKYDNAVSKVNSFVDLPVDWNSYGAEPISKMVVSLTLNFLGVLLLTEFDLQRVSASSDNSILIEGKYKQNRVVIEIFKNENVVLVQNNKKDVKFYDCQSSNELLKILEKL